MILLHPIYLMLLVPLVVALFVWKFRSRILRSLRAITYLLAVLALAGLTIRLPRQAGTVVVIADRSHSLPADSESSQKEIVDLLLQGMTADDQLAVVSFGRSAVVERTPSREKFAGFVGEVGRDESNMAEAMELGLGLIPRGDPGRLLLLSDGQWTGRDPTEAGIRASGRNVAIDHRVMQRPATGDVAIARIDAPSSVQPSESFLVTAWIYASAAQEATYEFRRGAVRLAAGKRKLEAGLNRLTFRDQAVEPGVQAYTAHRRRQGSRRDPREQHGPAPRRRRRAPADPGRAVDGRVELRPTPRSRRPQGEGGAGRELHLDARGAVGLLRRRARERRRPTRSGTSAWRRWRRGCRRRGRG